MRPAGTYLNGNYRVSANYFSPESIRVMPLRVNEPPKPEFPDVIEIITSPEHMRPLISKLNTQITFREPIRINIKGDNLLTNSDAFTSLLDTVSKVTKLIRVDLPVSNLLKMDPDKKSILTYNLIINSIGLILKEEDISDKFRELLRVKESYFSIKKLSLLSWMQENILGLSMLENKRGFKTPEIKDLICFFILDANDISIQTLKDIAYSRKIFTFLKGNDSLSNEKILELREFFRTFDEEFRELNFRLFGRESFRTASSLQLDDKIIEQLDLKNVVSSNSWKSYLDPNNELNKKSIKTVIIDSINGVYIDPVTKVSCNLDDVTIMDFTKL